jgi:polysaccharide export outer membrane protein
MTGEVAHQGTHELPSDEQLTVSRAILRAGGFSDFANKRKVKLIRKSGNKATTMVIDVAQVMLKGRGDLDPTLQAGDVVLVPARLINW